MKRQLTSLARPGLVIGIACAACTSSPARPMFDDAGAAEGPRDGGSSAKELPDAAAEASAPNGAEDAVVDNATIVVQAEHDVDPEDTTFAMDVLSVHFFAGPSWSAYGVTSPIGKCSNNGSGVQYNSSGAAGKRTGSNAIELVLSDDPAARTTLPWSENEMAYVQRWQRAMASSSPWRAGASFDVVDTDGVPPLQLSAVLELPSQPLAVTSPMPGARVSPNADLRVEWAPSDGLRVDVAIDEVSCAGNDNGLLVVPANLLANTTPRLVTVMRSRVRRLNLDDQVIHVIVTESVTVAVTGQ